ncbi:MAG: hypothetical protein U1D30_26025 [Planctomycetota bacterium]
MKSLFRCLGATVAAIMVAFLLVIGVEGFGAVAHPFPPDFQHSQEEMCRHVERFPAWVLAVVIPLWAGTAFIGTWIAGRWGNVACAGFVGVLLLAAVVLNLSMLPYPLWFKFGNLAAMPIAILVAGISSTRQRKTGS